MNEHNYTDTKRPQCLRKCKLEMREVCILRFLKMFKINKHYPEAGPPPQARTE
jgi:hypothetical protein